MLHSPIRTVCLSLLIGVAAGCGGKETIVVEECGEGMGRADDGLCYPLAGFGDSGRNGEGGGDDASGNSGDDGSGDGGSGDGGSGDEGSGDGGSGDDGTGDPGGGDDGTADGGAADGGGSSSGTGVPITITGVIQFDGTTESTANCNITSWVADAVDASTGQPDRGSYSENDIQFVACSDHPGGNITYSVEILADDTTEVAFFAFVDPDGDASTTDFRGGAENNPMTIVAGETYDDVNFFVPSELGEADPPE